MPASALVLAGRRGQCRVGPTYLRTPVTRCPEDFLLSGYPCRFCPRQRALRFPFIEELRAAAECDISHGPLSSADSAGRHLGGAILTDRISVCDGLTVRRGQK